MATVDAVHRPRTSLGKATAFGRLVGRCSMPRRHSPVVGVCRFCERRKKLIQSHIVSRFVVQHQKARAQTPNLILRHATGDLAIVQDGPKRPLLCERCDGLLGHWENLFARKFFRVLGSEPSGGLEYGPWLLKFCAATCWRIAADLREDGGPPNFTLAEIEATVRAQRTWKALVQDRSHALTPHDVHILPLNRGPSYGEWLDANSVAMHAYRQEGFAFMVAKLQHIMIFGSVLDLHSDVWVGTRIAESGTYGGEGAVFAVPSAVDGYLQHIREVTGAAVLHPLSEIKAQGRAPRMPQRRAPDYGLDLHFLGPENARRWAIEMRPIDERWAPFFVAFPSPQVPLDVWVRLGSNKGAPWTLSNIPVRHSRSGDWNMFDADLPVEPLQSAFISAELLPPLVLFGSRQGPRYYAGLAQANLRQVPPLPPELL
jgi:hypothetical protein